MKTIKLIIPVLLTLALVACASVGADIKAEAVVDSKANLKGYRTYSWLASMGVLKDPKGTWKPVGFDVDAELRFLIDKELRTRGMAPAEQAPDAIVVYLIMASTDAQPENIKRWFGKDADLSNKRAGALIIGLADPQTRKLVWAGAAIAQGKTTSTSEHRTRLGIAVKKIFKLYPR